MPCPKCGAPDRSVHPVWTDQQEINEHPKFIACEGCRNLIDPNDYIHGQSDTVGQAPLTDHEIQRLKPMGNQNTDRLTLIEWQVVKGAAAKYGVTDWTAKVDSTLTYEENISKMREFGTSGSSIKYVAAVETAKQQRDERQQQRGDD